MTRRKRAGLVKGILSLAAAAAVALYAAGANAATSATVTDVSPSAIKADSAQVSVFGIDLRTTTTDVLNGAKVRFTDVLSFTTGDLEPDTLAGACGGDATSCDGVQLWRDSSTTGSNQDTLDAGDTAVSTGFSFDNDCDLLSLCTATFAMSTTSLPTTAEGSYTFILAIRTSSSITNLDVFNLTLPVDAFTTTPSVTVPSGETTSQNIVADTAAPSAPVVANNVGLSTAVGKVRVSSPAVSGENPGALEVWKSTDSTCSGDLTQVTSSELIDLTDTNVDLVGTTPAQQELLKTFEEVTHTVCYRVRDVAGNVSSWIADGTVPLMPSEADVALFGASNVQGVKRVYAGVDTAERTFRVYVRPGGGSDLDRTRDESILTTNLVEITTSDVTEADSGTTDIRALGTGNTIAAGDIIAYTRLNSAGNEGGARDDGVIPAVPSSGALDLLYTSAVADNQRVAAAADASAPRTFALYLDPDPEVTNWEQAVTASGGSTPVRITTAATATTSGTTSIFAGTTALGSGAAVGYVEINSNGNQSNVVQDGTIPTRPAADEVSFSDAINKFQWSPLVPQVGVKVRLFVGSYTGGHDGEATNTTPVSVAEFAAGSALSYTSIDTASGNESTLREDGTIPAPPGATPLPILSTSAADGHQRVIAEADTAPFRTFRLYVDTAGATNWVRATNQAGTANIEVDTDADGSQSASGSIFAGATQLTGGHAVGYAVLDGDDNDSDVTADGTIPNPPNTVGMSVSDANDQFTATSATAALRVHLHLGNAGDSATLAYSEAGPDATASSSSPVTISDPVSAAAVYYTIGDSATENESRTSSDGSVPAPPTGDLSLLAVSAADGHQRAMSSQDAAGPRTFYLYVDPAGGNSWTQAVTTSGGSTRVSVTTSTGAAGADSATTTVFAGASGDTALSSAHAVGFSVLNAQGNDSDVAADGTIPAAPAANTTSATAATDEVTATGSTATNNVELYRSTSTDPGTAYAEGSDLTLDADTSKPLDLSSGDQLFYQVINTSTGNESPLTADGSIPAKPDASTSSVSAFTDAITVPDASVANNIAIAVFLDTSSTASTAYGSGTPDYTVTTSPHDVSPTELPAEYVYYTARHSGSGNESEITSDGSVPPVPTSVDGVMSASAATQTISANPDSTARTIRLYGDPAGGTAYVPAVTTSGGSTNVQITTTTGSQITSAAGIYLGANALEAGASITYTRIAGGNESENVTDGTIPAAPTDASLFSASAANGQATLDASVPSAPTLYYRVFRGSTPVSTRKQHTTGTATTITITTTLAGGDAIGYAGSNANLNESPILSDGTIPAAPSIALDAASESGRDLDDGIIKDNTPAFDVTGEPSASVRLFSLTNSNLVTGTTDGAGAAELTTLALSDATHEVRGALTLGGNESPRSSAVTIVVDTTAPDVPAAPDLVATSDTGSSDTDDLTKDATATLSVSTEADGDVTLLDAGDEELGAAFANGSGTAEATTSTLPDGANSITATVEDVAGNVSGETDPIVITVDTVAPTTVPNAVDVQAASDSGSSDTDDITNDTTPVVDITGADAANVVTLFDDGTAVATGTADGSGNIALTPSALSDGTHPLRASVVDAAGNAGTGSTAVDVVVDTIAPTAATPDLASSSDLGRSSTDDITNDTTPTISIDSEAGADTHVFEGATDLGNALANGSGVASITPTSPLTDAVHTLTATATDVAGNTSAASAGLDITIETVAPAAPSAIDLQAASDSGTSSSDDVTNDTTPTVDVTVAEADALVTLKDGATSLASETGTGTLALTSSALADGTPTLTATATDVAGNESAASSGLALTIDATAPAAPSKPDLQTASDTGSSTTDDVTTDTTPSIDLTTGESGMLLTLLDGATELGSVTPAGTTGSITTGTLAEGAHTLTATATDVAGNPSAASTALDLVIDTAIPSATVTAPTTLTGKPVVTFTEDVTGANATNVVLRLTGQTTNLPASVVYNSASKTATLTPSRALTAGQQYTVVVVPGGSTAPTDAAGNPVGSSSSAFRASLVEQENSVGAKPVWQTLSTSKAYGSSYRSEYRAGATSSFTFTGTSITWYTVRARNQGKATIRIDGVSKGTVDNYASSTAYRVARTYSGLSNAKHTIVITVTGTRRSGATGSRIAVDAFRVGSGSLTGASATFTWPRVATSAASGGAYVRTNLGGATYSFTFRGTGVDWYTVYGTIFGKAQVTIDGVSKGTFDNYWSSTRYNVRRSFTGLSDGVHTITIKVLGTKRAAATGTYVAVDRFVVK